MLTCRDTRSKHCLVKSFHADRKHHSRRYFDLETLRYLVCKHATPASPRPLNQYNRRRDKRVIIIPILGLVIGSVGGVVVVTYDVLIAIRGPRPGYQTAFSIWTEVLFATEFIVTWMVTGMIIGRLWYVGRRARAISDRSENRYSSIIRGFIESGALYSLAIGAFLIMWLPHWVSLGQLCACSTKLTSWEAIRVSSPLLLPNSRGWDHFEPHPLGVSHLGSKRHGYLLIVRIRH